MLQEWLLDQGLMLRQHLGSRLILIAACTCRQKWIVAYSGAEGAREARAALNMPRYQPPAASELHTYIVSLPGDGPRRRNAAEQMKAHGVHNWFFFDAINGSQGLPETEVFWSACLDHHPLAGAALSWQPSV